MVLNTGMRTDIPAFYSKWFMNRIREGYVLTRNPYDPLQVMRYKLDPAVVDILAFGTKNPAPLLPYMDELSKFRTYWFVTMNPYGRPVEPNVPEWKETAASIRELSRAAGPKAVSWRYDPVIVNDVFSVDWHIEHFEKMAEEMSGYVETCMIGFLDMYEKTKKNFPDGRSVRLAEKAAVGKAFRKISEANGIRLIGCYEDQDLAQYGIDVSGCMTHNALEHVGDFRLTIPKSETSVQKRIGSSASITDEQIRDHLENGGCILGNDIGAYNTCPHGCLYCYANYNKETAAANYRAHDPDSAYLTGGPLYGERIHDAKQESWIDDQISFL